MKSLTVEEAIERIAADYPAADIEVQQVWIVRGHMLPVGWVDSRLVEGETRRVTK